jgi:hypothetical protein
MLGVLVALFGPDYERSQLSAAEQERLSESDWFGPPWLIKGLGLAGVGGLVALGAGLVVLDRYWRSKGAAT